MQHATWSALESSAVAMGIYRFYRELVPPLVRTLARWLVMSRWNAAAALVRHRAANTVLTGPFKGKRLSLTPVSNRNLLAYLLGTQEAELHDVVRRVLARGYSRIINVGAADGYYALGLLRSMPNTKVTAFEGAAEHHILVETHDTFVPGCTAKLKARFSEAHSIEQVVARPRSLADFPSAIIPEPSKFMPRTAVELMNERCTGIRIWLYLTVKRQADVRAVPVVMMVISDGGSS